MKLRRDPNKRHIQPYSQESDDVSGKPEQSAKRREINLPTSARVASEFLLLAAIATAPFSVQAGFFSMLFSNSNLEQTTPVVDANSAADISLLTALHNPNPLRARGGADIVVDENVLVSTGPVGEDVIAEQKNSSGEIRVYTVREGDSLSQIAEMFGVTANTIMWANDINKATDIHSGDTLVILPIVGIQHTVKKGDTMGVIAEKYDGDVAEILAYNDMTSADTISIGDVLIIPGGAMSVSTRTTTYAQPVRTSGTSVASGAGLIHPAPGSVKTQGIHGYNAVDLAAAHGSSIRAAAAGEVIVSKSSGWNGGYGQYIVIRHSNGTQTLYSHLSRNSVGVGAYVKQGQVIGGMGTTGKSTGVHLHFEVRGGSNPF
ncbi:MAG: LysM peptidoglycan-binding domain-containing M23 family metallopeptidase [Candidatus Pacebacteria bacterium]|nr:LysM peptidoglycan-binding domain-containing M23 family metallopeptidase [Candidatus Paceibacterota bacterium]